MVRPVRERAPLRRLSHARALVFLRLCAALVGLAFLWSLLRARFALELPPLDTRVPLVLGLVGLSFTCYAARFALIVRWGGVPLGLRQSLRICATAQFYQALTPVSFGSDLTRYAMCRTAAPATSRRRLIGAILLDHLVGSIALALLAVPLLVRVLHAHAPQFSVALASGVALFALLGVGIGIRARLRRHWRLLVAARSAAVAALCLSVLMHVLLAVAVVLAATLWGMTVPIGEVVGVLACGALLQVVPVNLLGIHLGDAAGVGLYLWQGRELSQAMLLSTIAWTLRLSIAVLGGAWEGARMVLASRRFGGVAREPEA